MEISKSDIPDHILTEMSDRGQAFTALEALRYAKVSGDAEKDRRWIYQGMYAEGVVAYHLDMFQDWVQIRLNAEAASRKKYAKSDSWKQPYKSGKADLPNNISVKSAYYRATPFSTLRLPKGYENRSFHFSVGIDMNGLEFQKAILYGWVIPKELKVSYEKDQPMFRSQELKPIQDFSLAGASC